MTTVSYRKEWKEPYSRPGFGARFMGFVFRILPKIGPLKALAFKVPPPQGEKLFLESFDATRHRYRSLLSEVSRTTLQLANENFDTGQPTRLGAYWKADETYAKLLEELAGKKRDVSPDLRANIIAFYSGSAGPSSEKARAELTALRGQE